MSPAETARAHARDDAMTWHRTRAHDCRLAAELAGVDEDGRAYLTAKAEWHETVAAGIERAVRAER